MKIIILLLFILFIVILSYNISVNISESKNNYNVRCYDTYNALIYEGNSENKPEYFFWGELRFNEQFIGKKIVITNAKCILKEL